MKKLTIPESAIIGLFVGVLVAAYIVFLKGTGGPIGQMLGWISMVPALKVLNLSLDGSLVLPFIFFVAVYTLYGAIVGVIANWSTKALAVVLSLAALLAVGVYFDQRTGVSIVNTDAGLNVPFIAPVTKAVQKAPEQYFGKIEAAGDLNNDGADDVAFVITRNDPDRGVLYYLAAAIHGNAGYEGTNLIFLGDKIEPKQLGINKGSIIIEYLDHTKKNATTTAEMYAKVTGGVLDFAKSLNE